MITIRERDSIHREQGGWFDARWHFSFDQYRDPEQMGVGPLRVFNDDRLIPGAVWPMHPHRDVEGITYVVEGEFRHADSVGGDGVLSPGGVQRMTLGSGARHSEQNASTETPLRFLQFWLLPETASLTPEVEQRQFTQDEFRNQLRRVLGPDGDDVVKVHQDAHAYVAVLDEGVEVTHEFAAGRAGYLYVMDGRLSIDGEPIGTEEAAKIRDEAAVTLKATAPSHLVLVDVPVEFERVGVWAQ